MAAACYICKCLTLVLSVLPHRAWREGFTITLVSGRTVGIGAYLARLGRRCVQRTDQPIILTGYSALNKVLGRQVSCCTRPAVSLM
jgi:hypothetical protein